MLIYLPPKLYFVVRKSLCETIGKNNSTKTRHGIKLIHLNKLSNTKVSSSKLYIHKIYIYVHYTVHSMHTGTHITYYSTQINPFLYFPAVQIHIIAYAIYLHSMDFFFLIQILFLFHRSLFIVGGELCRKKNSDFPFCFFFVPFFVLSYIINDPGFDANIF